VVSSVGASSDLDALAEALDALAERDEACALSRNVSLASYTAMQVGGPVDLLAVCESVGALIEVSRLAQEISVPWRVLGDGCNVLISDQGLRGLVIVNRAASIQFEGQNVHAESGARLARVAQEAVKRGLAGLAWAAGLPGTVGGAVVGNAGAFGGDIAGALHSAMVLGTDGEVAERSRDWFEFEYRESRLKRGGGRELVLAAMFALQSGDPKALKAHADKIWAWRRVRHPSGATMGSTFKNPPDAHAGRLIEQAGLKGYRIGGAQVSEQHANFLINIGHATAEDVRTLITHVQTEVQRQLGVSLEPEVELLGW
jgi:UDP-N-acetylmuramate dehydrogenase